MHTHDDEIAQAQRTVGKVGKVLGEAIEVFSRQLVTRTREQNDSGRSDQIDRELASNINAYAESIEGQLPELERASLVLKQHATDDAWVQSVAHDAAQASKDCDALRSRNEQLNRLIGRHRSMGVSMMEKQLSSPLLVEPYNRLQTVLNRCSIAMVNERFFNTKQIEQLTAVCD